MRSGNSFDIYRSPFIFQDRSAEITLSIVLNRFYGQYVGAHRASRDVACGLFQVNRKRQQDTFRK